MWAGPLCVPVGGGPPARSPHASLRLGVVDLEARPGPAAAHRHLGPAPQATRASRFPPCVNPRLGVVDLEARPGPAAAHRHPPHRWGFSLLCTSHPGLAAHGHRRQAPQPGLSCPAAHASPSTPAVPGVLVVIGVVLKPGYALPPPTGTHRHRGQAPRASRFPQQRAVPGVLVGDRRRFEARLCPATAHRHPPAPRPGSAGLAVPSMREPAARSRRSRSPAKPSGTLHTGGAFHCCAHPIQAPPTTGTAAKPHSQASLVPQLTRRPPHRRCLVCWWVIGVVLKPGQVLPPPTGTAVGHQPGAVCPALVSNLARWGCSIRSWLAACRRRVAALMMSFPPF